MPGSRDPGNAVPEGVAPRYPAPLDEHDRAVRRKLEDLPEKQRPESKDEAGEENGDEAG